VIDSVLRYLTRRGLARAAVGRHPIWYVVAASAWLLQQARRDQVDHYRVELRPGERIQIRSRRRDEP
jgi:hypothetical protein